MADPLHPPPPTITTHCATDALHAEIAATKTNGTPSHRPVVITTIFFYLITRRYHVDNGSLSKAVDEDVYLFLIVIISTVTPTVSRTAHSFFFSFLFSRTNLSIGFFFSTSYSNSSVGTENHVNIRYPSLEINPPTIKNIFNRLIKKRQSVARTFSHRIVCICIIMLY